MSLFNTRTMAAKNFSTGSYSGSGRWTPGDSTDITIRGTAQPTSPERVDALMEGKRVSKAYDVFTATGSLSTEDPVGLIKASEVQIDGEWFIVILKEAWKNLVLSGYMYLCVRMKEGQA